MPSSIYDWSSTADDNADSDADLTWAEGQNPNTVNNSARMMMKRMRDLLTDLAGGTVVTGTANGLVLSTASNFTSLANGRVVSFRAASTNTGATTLNVNGTGAKAIMTQISGSGNALLAGQIIANGVYVVRYSATANGGTGAWILQSPPAGPVPVNGGGTGATTPAAARTALGLSALATQSVAAIANGGTSATSATKALKALLEGTIGSPPSGYVNTIGVRSGGIACAIRINTSTGTVAVLGDL